MAKSKKKRNKVYKGADAAIKRPVITKVSAVNRSKLGQWWFERKKFAKPIIITTLVAIFIIIIIVQIVRLAS